MYIFLLFLINDQFKNLMELASKKGKKRRYIYTNSILLMLNNLLKFQN